MKVLVIAAHPDDEMLGCGATVATLIEKGHHVKSVILGQGILSRGKKVSDLRLLQKHAMLANHAIGIEETTFHNFPDNAFDRVTLHEIIKTVEKELELFPPDIIFTHFGSDLNIDHQRTFCAVLTACRPQPNAINPAVYSFFIPSSTDWNDGYTMKPFIPNVFIDVSKTIQKKLTALSHYKTEMRDYPHSRSLQSVKNFSEYWGNRVGLEYAEPFMQIRGFKIC